jgi:two-component system nitrogen regulation sensor histidine kinase GlnL
LARGLAHEIKNPLGGIRGAAQLLSRELDPQADSELLDVIIDEVDRLSGLVDRLKGLESEQKNTSLNIHSVLERTRKLIESEHPQQIEVIRDYDPSIPELVGDPEQLMQAFLNLAKNAAQALLESDTPNPQLTICTRVVRQVVIAGQPHRLAIRVSLTDNGPGIPADLQETLFLPMVSGRAQGTGLGLAIAQQAVTRHQGLVEFDSEPGHTEFTITLPIRKMKGATA